MESQQSNEVNTTQVKEPKTAETNEWDRKLGTIGWALFFIWVGISFLADLNIGIGLLGIGIITLGIQVARRRYNLKFEGFWVVVGLIFVIGGLWDLFQPDLPLVPILLIIAGIVLLLSIARGKRSSK
jgi:hypothetical protein